MRHLYAAQTTTHKVISVSHDTFERNWQSLLAICQCAATARQFIQCNAMFDQHATGRSECEQRRSRSIADVPIKIGNKKVPLALQHWRHGSSYHVAPYAIHKGLHEQVDMRTLQDCLVTSHRSCNIYAELPPGRAYKGKFYEPEIQKVMPYEHFITDRILKTRRGVD